MQQQQQQEEIQTPQNVAETSHALNAILTTTNNDYRRFVEKAVVHGIKNHLATFGHYLWALLIDTSVDPGVRQLAAILLRKRILTLYSTLNITAATDMKATLLNLLANEEVRLVRLAIAHIITMLGSTEVGMGTWPELAQAMRAAMDSERPEHKHIALTLVFGISPSIGHATDDIISAAGYVLLKSLDQPDMELRVRGLVTVGVFLPYLDVSGHPATVALVKELVPMTLQTVQHHVNNEASVTMVLRTLEVLEQISAMHEKKHGDYLTPIITFMANTVGTATAHLAVRHAAADILNLILSSKPRMIYKKNLVHPFVDLSLQLMSEDERVVSDHKVKEEDNELDEEELELIETHPPAIIGGEIMQCLVECIPTKHVMPYLMERLMAVLSNLSGSTPLQRKGLMVALAVTAEGAAGFHRRQLTSILNVVKQLLVDDTPCVREATVFAIKMFILSLQPDILLHHTDLMSMMMPLIQDSCMKVRTRVIESIDCLAETLVHDVDQYVDDIIPMLLNVIGTSDMDCQAAIVSCLAGFSVNKPPSMAKHGRALLDMMREPLSLESNDETVPLKAVTMEAVGNIAVAVGREVFQDYFNFYCNLGMEFLQEGQRCELRENACGFFSNMAELLGRDFGEHLSQVVTAIVSALDEEEKVHTTIVNPLNAVQLKDDEMNKALDDEIDNAAEMDAAMRGGERVRYQGASLKERDAAIYALGIFCKTQRDLMIPFAEDIGPLMDTYMSYHSDRVVEGCVIALSRFCTIWAGPEPFPKVIEFPKDDSLSEKQREVVSEHLMTNILPLLSGHPDKRVVAAAFEAIQCLLDEYGAQAVHEFIDKIILYILTLLEGDGICQGGDGPPGMDDEDDGMSGGIIPVGADNIKRGGGGGGEDEDENGGDFDPHDNDCMDTVCDTIEELCKAYGPGFAPFFNELAPSLMKNFFKEDSPIEDIVMASGCLGESFAALGQAISPYADEAFRLAFYLLAQYDDSVIRGNACFILKNLVEYLPHQLNPKKTKEILDILWEICNSKSEIPQAQDNAISTALSLVRKLAGPGSNNALDDKSSLMVMKSALGYLPMKLDHTENKNATATICHVLENNSNLANEVVADLACCVCRMLASTSVEKDLKTQLANTFQTTMVQSHRQAVQQAVGTMPQRLQKTFSEWVC